MFKELIKLANHLDSRGFVKEADYLDRIIKKANFKYNHKDYDRYDKLGLITVDAKATSLLDRRFNDRSSQRTYGFLAKVFLSFNHHEFDDVPGTNFDGMIIGRAFHKTESEAKRLAIESAKSSAPLPIYDYGLPARYPGHAN